MGYNTTVVILNDGLHDIRSDPKLGENIYDAVSIVDMQKGGVTVPAGSHCNPIHIVESHHADGVSLVAVGGNTAQVISPYISPSRKMFGENFSVEVLKELASQLGYRVVKKG